MFDRLNIMVLVKKKTKTVEAFSNILRLMSLMRTLNRGSWTIAMGCEMNQGGCRVGCPQLDAFNAFCGASL